MASVVLTIIGRGEERKEFREKVVDSSKKISLSQLLIGVRKVQENSNAALTVMVTEEKSQNNKEVNFDSEEEEDDEDDNVDAVKEPPDKKPKSS